MILLWQLIKALPEIIKLLKAIRKGIDEMEEDRKVSDDIKSIHEAINAKDPSKLDALFRNSPTH